MLSLYQIVITKGATAIVVVIGVAGLKRIAAMDGGATFQSRLGDAIVPEISVLMPVYNGEEFLEACLASLRRQTFADFELVVVDDGSRDRSGEILAQRARQDARIRVLSYRHRGLVAALNAGLEACRAPWVARMDSDDISHPRRLELQREALASDSALDVVSCLVSHFPHSQVAGGFRVYEDWLNRLTVHDDIMRERFIESPLPHPSVMLRRQLLLDTGGYRDEGWPEDYDLWLRLAAQGARFGKVPRRLLFWRHHGGRLTCHHGRYRVERFLQCKAHHLVAGPLSDIDGLIVWGAGKTGRRLSKHLGRFGRPPEAFIDIDSRKIGRKLRGAPVFASEELPRLLDQPGKRIVLASVASRGAREIIRRHLQRLGLGEGREFWCVA